MPRDNTFIYLFWSDQTLYVMNFYRLDRKSLRSL